MQLLTPLQLLIPSSPIRQNITQKLHWQEQANLLPEVMALQDEQEILAVSTPCMFRSSDRSTWRRQLSLLRARARELEMLMFVWWSLLLCFFAALLLTLTSVLLQELARRAAQD